MISAVRRSSNDSSGWRWKSRLSATMPSRRRPISSAHSGVVLLMARSSAARGLVTPYFPPGAPSASAAASRLAAARPAGMWQGSGRPRGTRALPRCGWAPSRRVSSAAAGGNGSLRPLPHPGRLRRRRPEPSLRVTHPAVSPEDSGVEGTRSQCATTGVERPDGAQPQRSSARVPRGRLDPTVFRADGRMRASASADQVAEGGRGSGRGRFRRCGDRRPG